MPVQALRASRIREVANAGMGRDDVLPFWFGEPDEVTPALIRDAAKAALDAGDTFYTHNMGTPALREAIAAYASRLHRPVSADRIAVTSSGVSALMLVAQLFVNPGDRVVAVTPLWPNLVEIPRILGGEVISVPLQLNTASDAPRWELDLDQLIDALVPGTRALLLNSPNNPTGWVISPEQQQVVLAHCRKHGIWLLADDVYERLVYDTPIGKPACAPSFLDLAEPDERVVSTNSFSKSFLMTGWRLGWLQAPASLMHDLGKLIEYNTSCAPGFVQQAGCVALAHSEAIITHTLARYAAARDFLCEQLSAPEFRQAGVIAPRPQGTMYVFFRLDGERDSLALCKRLVAEAGLGLAPGSAFGPEGEGAIRWCFASSTERLALGVERLASFLRKR
jgi:aspartate/methionine/tyrosine aminotransferase